MLAGVRIGHIGDSGGHVDVAFTQGGELNPPGMFKLLNGAVELALDKNRIKILESICKMIKFMMRKNTWVLKVRVEAVILVKEKRLKHIIQLKKGKILKRIY